VEILEINYKKPKKKPTYKGWGWYDEISYTDYLNFKWELKKDGDSGDKVQEATAQSTQG